MGSAKQHPPVKLIVGFIFQEEGVFKRALALLEKRFGGIDFESAPLAFTHTDYYRAEFGRNLKRKFISFTKLIRPEALAKIKNLTNNLEKKLSCLDKRRINIDPGYLELSKIVLATTKDYKHRLYLNSGIYAEVTLFYQDKAFQSWDWTYPDYKTQEYSGIFLKIRQIYKQQLK